MKIEKIAVTHVRIPLIEPFRISSGQIAEKDAILVAIQRGGLIGYGESSPMAGSFYSEETPETAWKCLVEQLIPRVLQSKPHSVQEVNACLDAVEGNSFAKAGIETAFWDLEAQEHSVPLAGHLGGARTRVESGLAAGIYLSARELTKTVERFLADGYKRLKIKIKPGWDIEPLTEIRKRFGSILLMVDANCAYTRADLNHLKVLDEFDLMMIEQPLPKDDLEGHAILQQVVRTPVCLDEGAKDVLTVQQAVGLKACQIVNIKIQRVGGLLNAKNMHDLCAQAGIPVWGGTMPELGVGAAQTLHLATLDNFEYPTDVESSKRWFVDDIIDPLIEVHNGYITLPAGVGNCYKVNDGTVRRYKVREESFR